jgi:hypothetical protein
LPRATEKTLTLRVELEAKARISTALSVRLLWLAASGRSLLEVGSFTVKSRRTLNPTQAIIALFSREFTGPIRASCCTGADKRRFAIGITHIAGFALADQRKVSIPVTAVAIRGLVSTLSIAGGAIFRHITGQIIDAFFVQ